MCASCAPAADSARPRGAAYEGFARNRQIRSQPSPIPAHPSGPLRVPVAPGQRPCRRLESGIRPRPSRVVWSQCGRSFGPLLPDRASGDRSLSWPRGVQSTRFQIWCSIPRRTRIRRPPCQRAGQADRPRCSPIRHSVPVAPHGRLRLHEEASFQLRSCGMAACSCRSRARRR